MRPWIAILAFTLALPIGGEAEACFYTAVANVGGDAPYRTKRQRAEAERKALEVGWKMRIGQRSAAAQAELAAGIDAPERLADMLVPNVRPVPMRHSDCGPMGDEVDVAEGDESFADILAGTPVAAHHDDFAAITRQWHGEISFGIGCNDEFRELFAAHLRRRLTAEQLRSAYLFLRARSRIGERVEMSIPLRRLTAFEGATRRPPVRWFTEDPLQEKQIKRWVAADPAGQALQTAADDFWREHGNMLDDANQLCPRALAQWPAVRAPLVAEVEGALAARRARQAKRP
ncbi:MAG TPA: hypothetical protein VGB70_02010 [Allosphingosinicella sp.]|jgi:hypothetical protein